MRCKNDTFTIGKLLVEKNTINDSPTYQRESGIWSLDKKQLFLDSLFNQFDVPKLYFHDVAGAKQRYDYAVIDGKQRLNAIWEFLDDRIALADDFEIYDVERAKSHPIKGGLKYSKLAEYWRETFKSTTLAVTVVEGADSEDIEELFSRLNNGEPLSAAERRNAKASDMVDLIRMVAGKTFFRQKVAFGNKRLQHHEVAAKFLLIERSLATTGDMFCDLKKRYLDQLVDQNKKMTEADKTKLTKAVDDTLKQLSKLFSREDFLLSKQAYPPMYYLFVKLMVKEYAHKDLSSRLKKFIEDFTKARAANLLKKEEERDVNLVEFGRLMQQGTNDLNSLRQRVALLRRYFLQDYPDTPLRDKKRLFTDEERMVIWQLGDKKCAKCSKPIPTLEEMQADHHMQWAHGGPTSLKNGRCLCESCNQEEKAA
jgi:hypothetical protein